MNLYLKPRTLLAFSLTFILGYILVGSNLVGHRFGTGVSAAKTVAAPNFTLKTLDGKKISLSDFRGKYVFLNFWATWCFPCRVEMPSMEKLYQEFKSSPFQMVAVSLDRQGEKIVRPFVNDKGFNFMILLDENNSTVDTYGVSGIPSTLIISPEGNIIDRLNGATDWSKDEVFDYFKGLLNGHKSPASVESTSS